MAKELIIAGYPTQHAALLARAALSRQQDDLSISTKDVAVVCRENNGHVTILESISIGKVHPRNDSFWKTLAELLFPENTTGDNTQLDIQNKLKAIGIDPQIEERIAQAVPLGSTALLVMASIDSRSQVSALLSACQGTVTQIRLECDGSESCLNNLKNTPNG